jgi:hypothetical protein
VSSDPTVAAKEPRAVFLLGAPRSGTSLLYKVLCMHPQAAWISNYHRRIPAVPQVNALNRVARALPDRADDVWFGSDSNAYVYASKRTLSHRLFPMPVEGETVFGHVGLPEEVAQADPSAQRRIARTRRNLGRVVRWSGGSVLVSKRIGHNRRIPLLHEALPHARFLDITRDGRAVAASIADVDWWPGLDVWWHRGTPEDWSRTGRDPWELCARHWVEEVDAIRAGLAAVPADQVLSLRYEDLVEDPTSVLARVAEFAGLPGDDAWARRVSALGFPNKNERWRTRLGDDGLRVVERVQSERLGALGYL